MYSYIRTTDGHFSFSVGSLCEFEFTGTYLCHHEEHSHEAEEDTPCSSPEVAQVGSKTDTSLMLVFLRKYIVERFCPVGRETCLWSFRFPLCSLLMAIQLIARGFLLCDSCQVSQHLIQSTSCCGVLPTSLDDLFEATISNGLALIRSIGWHDNVNRAREAGIYMRIVQ